MPEPLPLAAADAQTLALFAAWQQAESGRRATMLMVEGAEAVRWLLRSKHQIIAIIGKPTTLTSLRPELDGFLDEEQARVYQATRRELAELLGFPFDRGVVALARRPRAWTREHWQEDLLSRPHWRLLVCDAIHDPANLGTIMRSARCLGMHGVLLGPGCADPWSRRCLRTGVGHPLLLAHQLSDDLQGDLGWLRLQHCQLLAAHRGPRSQDLAHAPAGCKRWALVLGNEDRGLQPSTLEQCDSHLHIPMAEHCDSLNVAAAAAICMQQLVARDHQADQG